MACCDILALRCVRNLDQTIVSVCWTRQTSNDPFERSSTTLSVTYCFTTDARCDGVRTVWSNILDSVEATQLRNCAIFVEFQYCRVLQYPVNRIAHRLATSWFPESNIGWRLEVCETLRSNGNNRWTSFVAASASKARLVENNPKLVRKSTVRNLISRCLELIKVEREIVAIETYDGSIQHGDRNILVSCLLGAVGRYSLAIS